MSIGIRITKDARDSKVTNNRLGIGLGIEDNGKNTTIVYRKSFFRKILDVLLKLWKR